MKATKLIFFNKKSRQFKRRCSFTVRSSFSKCRERYGSEALRHTRSYSRIESMSEGRVR